MNRFEAALVSRSGGKNTWKIRCVCDGEGELTLDATDRGPVGCPDCGATAIQWDNPLTGRPELTVVAAPVFAEPGEDEDDWAPPGPGP